jgi:hypothetical protein
LAQQCQINFYNRHLNHALGGDGMATLLISEVRPRHIFFSKGLKELKSGGWKRGERGSAGCGRSRVQHTYEDCRHDM